MAGVLGAIMAGGEARRFGSDKALALFEGRPLIDHVATGLRGQTDAVVVVGRHHGGLTSVADRPARGLGPLGALAGALHWAQANGFAAVLSAPCDVPLLPDDLAMRLAGEGAAYVDGLPVLGWWPSVLADDLAEWLAADRPRAVRQWAAAVGARLVVLEGLPANVNTQEDLAALRR
ncbi:molybdenum cofactor guanylyltransferase [Sphingomonas jeddahensis]|uniref:Molybdenum cofactor guanylyltransferase n=1 Tax=Sphingomonas jeddahensis TaxID=1915074 RepID=A0A1V2EXL3_9SPHN|nr:molybdenum cofactor guanylyltransferase [Sphingomonas jeddahensis]ONF96904.1 Molybdenum cofactor guanylyltransferase [Sphingomonas jeddahensis]